MRVLYIARHGQDNADDEGAITHALLKLGHSVHTLPEDYAQSPPTTGYDLCLFHKWRNPLALRRMKFPKAFFYFDLVDCPDNSLRARCEARRAWMREVLPHVELGACTDGDWVEKVNRDWRQGSLSRPGGRTDEPLVWLPQGADERVVGRGKGEPVHDVLFTGIGKGGGRDRMSFVEEMRARYGDRFHHVERGVHGRALADLVAQSRVVVAPDSPVTDRYWSNRVYVMLGFGAFLLHPWCEGLTRQYEPGEQVVYYRSRWELHDFLGDFTEKSSARAEQRRRVSEAGLERTLAEHLYRHRVAELLRVCRERGLVP